MSGNTAIIQEKKNIRPFKSFKRKKNQLFIKIGMKNSRRKMSHFRHLIFYTLK